MLRKKNETTSVRGDIIFVERFDIRLKIVYNQTRLERRGMTKNNLIYLDRYVLQQDLRVRLPKSVLLNLDLKKGETMFDIYFNPKDNSIVLKIEEQDNNYSEVN